MLQATENTHFVALKVKEKEKRGEADRRAGEREEKLHCLNTYYVPSFVPGSSHIFLYVNCAGTLKTTVKVKPVGMN